MNALQQGKSHMRKLVLISIVVMGFSGLLAEILILRELLVVFSGNELCIGIILANWLILEAFGSYIAGRFSEKRRNSLELFTLATIFFCLSLVPAVYLTRILKPLTGVSIGESMGFWQMFYTSFLILMPVSIFHGALFTLGCRIYYNYFRKDESSAGKVYVYETIGTILGGIACTFWLIPYIETIQAFFILVLINLVLCFFLFLSSGDEKAKAVASRKAVTAVLIILIISAGYIMHAGWAGEIHRYSLKRQWQGHNLVHYGNSRYGNIAIVENEGQYIYFLDGIPAIMTPIPEIHFIEEFVHIPLLAHPEPSSLLIVHGGAGGVINEALKHPSVKAVDYAELDPMIPELLKMFPTDLTEAELGDERVRIKPVDGLLHLKEDDSKYDIIFIGTMEPLNLQSNRFFTREFYLLAKTRMNEGGILVTGLPGSLTYLNQELKNLNSSVYHTLGSVFEYIRVIPGEGINLFLSSDSPGVSEFDITDIVNSLEKRNMGQNISLPWHIERKLHHGWQGWFSRFLEGSSKEINYRYRPTGMYYSLTYWNAVHAPALGRIYSRLDAINMKHIAGIIVIFIMAGLILGYKNKALHSIAIPISIITTGFSGMLFSLIVIFAFQSIYGYVFSWIGLLVASYMAGAAGGAMIVTSIIPSMNNSRIFALFRGIEPVIAVFSISLPLLLYALNNFAGIQVFRLSFLIISLLCGLLTSFQFPLANRLHLYETGKIGSTAGKLYASDLMGGWLGGMLGALVLLPVLGLSVTCITAGSLKIASFITLSVNYRRGGRQIG